MQRVDSNETGPQQTLPPPSAPPPQPQPPPATPIAIPGSIAKPASSQQQQPKALRFVTNSGPLPKRRRIGAACLTCRKRKTACSGERPNCETCKQNKLECAGYSESNATPGHNRVPSEASNRRQSQQESVSKSRGAGLSSSRAPLSPGNGSSSAQHGNDLHRTISGGLSPRTAGEKRPRSADDFQNGDGGPASLFSGPRNRMPYFRWLGPTAIMPGFKQMVVKVKRNDTEGGVRTSTDGGVRSPSLNDLRTSDRNTASMYSTTPAAADAEMRTPLNLPFYDTSPVPPSELITHLANTFFTHLGCNYPFLQRARFLKDLEEKQVDPVLVDAVCALAARFSTHSLLTQSQTDGEKATPAEYGHAFAQRAKSALTDTFPVPSVAASQAALLLAYNEFGEQRDSGLWMYLGISIRLAQDLGLHKLEGLKYVGRDGPTPRMVKRDQRASSSRSVVATPFVETAVGILPGTSSEQQSPEEARDREEAQSVEQERVDTFWAIFFLDRVVSSGTGRRSTLRDKDIEISLPSLTQTHDKSDWPAPFPALIRIVHLYGRVADLLNSIKEASDITAETPKRLAAMESQVTNFYQNLSPRLHFDAVNFQHYMKAGEGTNFVLLHFWFHTLIVILHQPTLLKTFAGRMLQLFPNSQQLSMSSAKTIADILSYSQLMDAKASLGNPFTSQPIYIAACAFLRETVEQTATSNAQSRASSPSRTASKSANSDSTPSANGTPHEALRKASISSITVAESSERRQKTSAADKSQLAKHTLLATAATQHYQLCYKALQSLETYWAGTKYILTVLDQKFEGVGDPLLYTAEEGESSMEQPRPEPAFTSPGWRRKLSWGPYITTPTLQSPFWPPKVLDKVPGSPRQGVDPSKAIGWTFSGDMNSKSTNLAWHFAGDGSNSFNIDPRPSSLAPSAYEAATAQAQQIPAPSHGRAAASLARHSSQESVSRHSAQMKYAGVSNSDAENLLALSSPYNQHGNQASPPTPMSTASFQQQSHSIPTAMSAPPNGVPQHSMQGSLMGPQFMIPGSFAPNDFTMTFMPGNMMIESQDVDMNMLGLDAMPWFDSYPPPDMNHLFDHSQATGGAGNPSAGNGRG
ncbi:hypothetical protein Slin14017_G026860 [Septoria linicola]|nr:hypothetical protein Slin14017_G026860 [Septoria linicola]